VRLLPISIELALVQRALNLAPLQKAITHAGTAMGADVVGGKNLTLHLVEGNVFACHHDTDHIALGHRIDGCHIHPVLCHKVFLKSGK